VYTEYMYVMGVEVHDGTGKLTEAYATAGPLFRLYHYPVWLCQDITSCDYSSSIHLYRTIMIPYHHLAWQSPPRCLPTAPVPHIHGEHQ